MHYAGSTACTNQYLHGIRDGRQMKRAGGEPALVSVEQPEEPGQEPTEQ
jgi:hypothetical protein